MRMEDRVSSLVNSSNSLKKINNKDKGVDNNMDTRMKNQLERSNQDSESHPLQDKIQKAGSQDKPRVNSSDPLEKIPKLGHHSRDHRQELRIRDKSLVKTHKLGRLNHLNREPNSSVLKERIHRLGHHSRDHRQELNRSSVHWGRTHKPGLLKHPNRRLRISDLL